MKLKYKALALLVLVMAGFSGAAMAQSSEFVPLGLPDGWLINEDVNGDGWNDFIMLEGNRISIFWSRKGEYSKKPDQQIYTAADRNSVFLADLNGDKFKDLLLQAAGAIYWFDKKTGRFDAEPTAIPLADGGLFDYADVNADGKTDVVVINKNGVLAFLQNGNAFAVEPIWIIREESFLNLLPGGGVMLEVPKFWNFVFDFDGDGREDVFFPRVDNFYLLLQKVPGKFTKVVMKSRLDRTVHASQRGFQSGIEKVASGYVFVKYALPEIITLDVNDDKLPDVIVNWGIVYLQQKDGTYPDDPLLAGGDLSDKIAREYNKRVYALNPQNDDQDGANPFKSLLDIDGDGAKDRVSNRERYGVGGMKSEVRIFFGVGEKDTTFPKSPDQIIVDKNFVPSGALFTKINDDDALDLIMFSTRFQINDLVSFIKANRGEVKGELNFYFFDKGARSYPRNCSLQIPISLKFKISSPGLFSGKIFRYMDTVFRVNSDFNGDGKKDLLIRTSNEKLQIFLNLGPDSFFAKDPHHSVFVPDFDFITVQDIDGDGKADIMMKDARSSKIRVLLSRCK